MKSVFSEINIMRAAEEYLNRKRQGLETIIDRMPDDIARSLRGLPVKISDQMEEIRFRAGKPVRVYSGGREYEVVRQADNRISYDEIQKIFNLLMHHSAYTYQEEIRKGYITLDGGHRVGICGRVICDGDKVVSVRDVSSINIRRGCEYPGVSDSLIPYLTDSRGIIRNTILISPPKCGKTTVLRDIARNISNKGYKVGICDERSEIAGCYGGVPAFDVGMRTDILDGCPKSVGIDMLIRAMSPDVVVVDEIGSGEDALAVERASVAGVSIIATMHGRSFEDVLISPLGKFLKNGTFTRIVILSAEPTPGTVADIRNSANMSLVSEPEMVWKE